MARTPKSKIVKSIPNNETDILVTNTTMSGQKYLITRNFDKNKFTLWKPCEEGFEKIVTADSPLDFDDVIPWED